MKINDLKKQYESACNVYVAKFCKKQGIDFEFWVADIIGGVVCCNGFYFNFQDIVWDINSKQPKDLIIKWYDDVMEQGVEAMNYYCYTKSNK